MPVLVTGGYGFIGSNLVRRLVTLGAQVAVVDAFVPDSGANRFNLAGLEQVVAIHVVDMADEDAMREPVRGSGVRLQPGGTGQSRGQPARSVRGPQSSTVMRNSGYWRPAASTRRARGSSSPERASSTGGPSTFRSTRATRCAPPTSMGSTRWRPNRTTCSMHGSTASGPHRYASPTPMGLASSCGTGGGGSCHG